MLLGGSDHSGRYPHSRTQIGWPDIPAIHLNVRVRRNRETVYCVIPEAKYHRIGRDEAYDGSIDLGDVGYGGLLHAPHVDMRQGRAGFQVSWGDGLAVH
jgi:hypothetical protein